MSKRFFDQVAFCSDIHKRNCLPLIFCKNLFIFAKHRRGSSSNWWISFVAMMEVATAAAVRETSTVVAVAVAAGIRQGLGGRAAAVAAAAVAI